ncbi:MAG: hypothetical protein E6613_04035 [Haemophilus parainfluenzae]|nr:hypothetical protein [Haemophilus parainfluenzae]
MASNEELQKKIINAFEEINKASTEAYKHVPQGQDFTNFIISKIENGKEINISKWIIEDINEILGIIKAVSKSKEVLINKALYRLGVEQEIIDGFIGTFRSFDELAEVGINTLVNTKIIPIIDYMNKLTESAPSVSGYLNGKKPRAKSQDRIDAECSAMKMWKEDNMLSIEHVAKEVIFALNLQQSLQTVKAWIKPLDPLIGTGIKRKRRSKK